MSDNMTIVQFLRASGEHWDEDRYTAGADRIEALEAALRKISKTYGADNARLIHSQAQILGIARALISQPGDNK